MATQAFNAQKTTISREDPATPGTYEAIAEIKTFGGLGGGSANVIDATTLDSDGKEKLMGLLDEGQLTLEVNFVPRNLMHQALIQDRKDQALRNFKITFSDNRNVGGTPTSCIISAYVLSFNVSGGVDALTAGSIALEISDAADWTFGAAAP